MTKHNIHDSELMSKNVCKIEVRSSGARLFLKRDGSDSGGTN